jgi:hypothetical protein
VSAFRLYRAGLFADSIPYFDWVQQRRILFVERSLFDTCRGHIRLHLPLLRSQFGIALAKLQYTYKANCPQKNTPPTGYSSTFPSMSDNRITKTILAERIYFIVLKKLYRLQEENSSRIMCSRLQEVIQIAGRKLFSNTVQSTPRSLLSSYIVWMRMQLPRVSDKICRTHAVLSDKPGLS